MPSIIEGIVTSLYSEDCYNKDHSKIYKLHKYWARKPWYIVERYINEYSAPGEIVMDPFCGSGCTGSEAIINGRNFIGQDLNPSALHVSKGTMLEVDDLNSLDHDFAFIIDACKKEIMSLYVTDQSCERCGEPLYFKYINIGPKFEGNYNGALYCECCKSKSMKRALTEHELIKMRESDNLEITEWVPEIEFPKKFYKDRFSYKGISKVSDMYTHRNLFALSLLYKAVTSETIINRDLIMLAFTNTVLHVSKLKGENVRPLGVNNYWVPDDYYEENVWFRFEDRLDNVIKSKKQQKKRCKEKKKEGLGYGSWSLQMKSALDDMGTNCIDYFFTDPPYGDAIQYSELSYVWNAWLGKTYNTDEEVIINPVQNKGADEFQNLLSVSLDNIYRALKPERYFTLCFQNKNSDIWKNVVSHCKRIGFKLVDISIYDTYGSPFNKSWADFSPKSDIYVTFQKTEQDTLERYSKAETIESIIKDIKAFMKNHNISDDNNKMYDYVIAYLIWALYLNDQDIDVKGFDIKKFTKLVAALET